MSFSFVYPVTKSRKIKTGAKSAIARLLVKDKVNKSGMKRIAALKTKLFAGLKATGTFVHG